MSQRHSKAVPGHPYVYIETEPSGKRRYFTRVDPFDSQKKAGLLATQRFWTKGVTQKDLKRCDAKSVEFLAKREAIGGRSDTRRKVEPVKPTGELKLWGYL